MICSGSANMLLITCVLFVPHSWGSSVSAAPAKPAVAVVSSSVAPGTGRLTGQRLPRRAATFSQFVPWRNRVKSVIEERVYEVVDECDLGPAIPPDRSITSVRIISAERLILVFPPLRC
jgi:hypothetical protein